MSFAMIESFQMDRASTPTNNNQEQQQAPPNIKLAHAKCKNPLYRTTIDALYSGNLPEHQPGDLLECYELYDSVDMIRGKVEDIAYSASHRQLTNDEVVTELMRVRHRLMMLTQ